SDDEAVGSGPDAPSRALPAVTTAMAAPAMAAAMRPVPAPPDQGGVAIIGVSLRTAGANDAGERLRGSRCGVFVGVEEGVPGEAADGLATSHHNGILAARISYVLDLKGPNLAINTACSSGLVAVHTACQSVQRGECELALAGGVNVLNSPLTYVALT
uniref:beta-ketoacyl synthase N-terminal-like domain-containing protein n=1 Tax=Burkholderia vietnamiensis TaxID=60552 RepID=UPI002446023A